jgi:hypothetical protein
MPASFSAAVGAIRATRPGLDNVFVELDGQGYIAPKVVTWTEVTGTTEFSLLFDGVPASCRTIPDGDASARYDTGAIYARCPAPPELDTIVFTCPETTTAFSLSLYLGGSCDFPGWCVAK